MSEAIRDAFVRAAKGEDGKPNQQQMLANFLENMDLVNKDGDFYGVRDDHAAEGAAPLAQPKPGVA